MPAGPLRGEPVVVVAHTVLERVEDGLRQKVDLQGCASWVTLEVTGAAMPRANWLIWGTSTTSAVSLRRERPPRSRRPGGPRYRPARSARNPTVHPPVVARRERTLRPAVRHDIKRLAAVKNWRCSPAVL